MTLLFRTIAASFLVAGFAVLTSCDGPSLPDDGKPRIYVPVPPYAGIIEELAGDFVHVESLISEQDDPHSYSPTPKELTRLSSAALYFTADLPFENNLVEKLGSGGSNIKIVSLVDQLERRSFEEGEHDHGGHDDDHGHDDHGHDDHGHDDHGHDDPGHDDHGHDDHGHDDHSSDELDPHVWLAPNLLIEQVKLLKSQLAPILATDEEKKTLETNASDLIQKIRETDKELAVTLTPLRGKAFYVYHGAFGYFADAYGLKQVAVELNGRSPEPRQIANMIDRARAEGVTVIFVQPQFDQTSATALAESIGGTVLAIDPLAKDVLANLREIASKLTSPES